MPKPKAHTPRRPKQRHNDGPRIRWDGLNTRPKRGKSGGRPFYKLETLAAAVELLLRRGDCFLLGTAREVLGPSDLSNVSFTFHRETEYQVVFRMAMSNERRKRKTLAFVAARNDQEFSTLLKAEHEHLQKLHKQLPQHIVRPYHGGLVYLPDRYHRKERGRSVYVYLTEWLPDWVPLGAANARQLAAAGEPRHVFSLEDTALLRRKIIETLWQSYEPAQGVAIELAPLEPGDFAVSTLRGKPLKLRLIACRRMKRRVRPVTYLAQLIDMEWQTRGHAFPLPPEDPEELVGIMEKAGDTQTARRWLRQLADRCESGRVAVQNRAYVDALAGIVMK